MLFTELSRVPIVFVMLLYLFFFSLFVLHCYMVLFAVNKPIIILYYLQSGLVTWFQNFRVHIQNQVTTILQNLSSVNG
jgi:glucan phosphoethanolaminetransferase (alkaline phosphatase superfamily)